jgi:hypothetical protein
VLPGARTLSVFLLSNWIGLKTEYCLFKMLICWTEPLCLISNLSCQSLTALLTFGPDGLIKPEKLSQTEDRTVGSNRPQYFFLLDSPDRYRRYLQKRLMPSILVLLKQKTPPPPLIPTHQTIETTSINWLNMLYFFLLAFCGTGIAKAVFILYAILVPIKKPL